MFKAIRCDIDNLQLELSGRLGISTLKPLRASRFERGGLTHMSRPSSFGYHYLNIYMTQDQIKAVSALVAQGWVSLGPSVKGVMGCPTLMQDPQGNKYLVDAKGQVTQIS